MRLSAETVRRWMRDAELWERQRKRAKHRSRRPRRAATVGELCQWDSLRRHGRPLAFYADHAGHFGQWMTKQGRRTDTIISRGLDKLGVKMILAGSAQAKGRVERSFGTAQDRLIKVPFWNERFTVAPGDPCDAHRPLPADVDLAALFAETHVRVVANDFTVRFRNRYWPRSPNSTVHGVPVGHRIGRAGTWATRERRRPRPSVQTAAPSRPTGGGEDTRERTFLLWPTTGHFYCGLTGTGRVGDERSWVSLGVWRGGLSGSCLHFRSKTEEWR